MILTSGEESWELRNEEREGRDFLGNEISPVLGFSFSFCYEKAGKKKKIERGRRGRKRRSKLKYFVRN